MQPTVFLTGFFILIALAAIPYAYWELKHGYEAGWFVVGISYLGAIFLGVIVETILGLTELIQFAENHIFVVTPLLVCFLHNKIMKILRAKHEPGVN